MPIANFVQSSIASTHKDCTRQDEKRYEVMASRLRQSRAKVTEEVTEDGQVDASAVPAPGKS